MAHDDRRLGGDTAILGDAAVRVVVFARQMRDQIVAAGRHPAGEDMLRQPVAPVNLQIAFDSQVRSGQDHVGNKEDRYHADLGHETAHGVLLQGVEQVRAPLCEQHGHDHLKHCQDSQKEDRAPDFYLFIRAPELLGQPEKFDKKIAGFRHVGSGFNE